MDVTTDVKKEKGSDVKEDESESTKLNRQGARLFQDSSDDEDEEMDNGGTIHFLSRGHATRAPVSIHGMQNVVESSVPPVIEHKNSDDEQDAMSHKSRLTMDEETKFPQFECTCFGCDCVSSDDSMVAACNGCAWCQAPDYS